MRALLQRKLPRRDLTAILGVVHRDLWRQVLPTFSWWSLRRLPTAICSRAKERIVWIGVTPHGAVEVVTQIEVRWGRGASQEIFHCGHTYVLKRNGLKWEIVGRGDWEE